MRKLLFVILTVLVLLLTSCTPAEKLEILGVDSGVAVITIGDTFVIVNHDLGVVPSDVQLTLTGDPGIAVTYWVKNPTADFFGIEINGISASDIHFYWRVER